MFCLKSHYAWSILAVSGVLAGCAASSSLPASMATLGKHEGPRVCSTVHASSGKTYTVAHLGGGSLIDVESADYKNCTVGIYIGPKNGPALLNHAIIGGRFHIGVYVDSVRAMHGDYLSICVNEAYADGGCKTGDKRSPGTGIYVWSSPHLSISNAYIDGYVAGFATTPCPNAGNRITDDYTTITRSTYPWSYEGGKNRFDFEPGHDSPVRVGGSCAGSHVGAGTGSGPGGPEYLYVNDYLLQQRGQPVVAAYNINGGDGSLTRVQGSPYTVPFAILFPVADPGGAFLYSGVEGNSVTGYVYADAISAIQHAPSGSLSPVSGSPFFLTNQTPQGITVDPQGRFLYAAIPYYSQLIVESIDPTSGALTQSQAVSMPWDTIPWWPAVHPTGKFVYVANYGSYYHAASIDAYSVNATTGTLTPVYGSPFPTGLGTGSTGLTVDGSGKYLYVSGGTNGTVDLFTIDAYSGALTLVTTFQAEPLSSYAFAPSIVQAGSFLYVLGADTISAFSINPSSGYLTQVYGSPFAAGPYGATASEMAVDPAGQFLYVSNITLGSQGATNGSIYAYSIDSSTGYLTAVAGSPYDVGNAAWGLTVAQTSNGGSRRFRGVTPSRRGER